MSLENHIKEIFPEIDTIERILSETVNEAYQVTLKPFASINEEQLKELSNRGITLYAILPFFTRQLEPRLRLMIYFFPVRCDHK